MASLSRLDVLATVLTTPALNPTGHHYTHSPFFINVCLFFLPSFLTNPYVSRWGHLGLKNRVPCSWTGTRWRWGQPENEVKVADENLTWCPQTALVKTSLTKWASVCVSNTSFFSYYMQSLELPTLRNRALTVFGKPNCLASFPSAISLFHQIDPNVNVMLCTINRFGSVFFCFPFYEWFQKNMF